MKDGARECKRKVELKIKERVTKMKKMILTVVALMSMTVLFAENDNAASVNAVQAYDMTVNMKKLSEALNLSKDQVEGVEEVHKTFAAEMVFAAQYGKEELQKMVEKAINKDLAYMNYMLNKDQYRKYVMLLNVTLNNRGIR